MRNGCLSTDVRSRLCQLQWTCPFTSFPPQSKNYWGNPGSYFGRKLDIRFRKRRSHPSKRVGRFGILYTSGNTHLGFWRRWRKIYSYLTFFEEKRKYLKNVPMSLQSNEIGTWKSSKGHLACFWAYGLR